MKLHPQVIEKGGKSEFVILPFDEYQALTELMQDYEDLRDLREAKEAAKGEQGRSLTELMSELEIDIK